MKKYGLFLVAVLLTLSSLAYAENKPTITEPRYVAMVFAKLSGRVPDFDTWAKDSEAYQKAPEIDKIKTLDTEAKELKRVYSLMTIQEPIVLDTPIQLAKSTTGHAGYFVESFKEYTFFPIAYRNQFFAVVPQGLMDRQWLNVADPASATALDVAIANKAQDNLVMRLSLTPNYVDGKTPAHIDGQDYWLISAKINRMIIFDRTTDKTLWQSMDPSKDNAEFQKLLKLRQP